MKHIDFSSLIKSHFNYLQAYNTKEIHCKIKLDANESPFCPISIQEILQIKDIHLNRYPDGEAFALKIALAKDLSVKPENILIGNGSDELISYLIITLGGPVIYPVPTFSMYGIISQILEQTNICIPLDKNFDIDITKFSTVIRKVDPKIIFLSSPNNPTGNCFSLNRIMEILDMSKGIVVVDEAYQPFSRQKSLVSKIKDIKNLAVLRTLSKIGFAGIRTGFLIAHPDLIKEINKSRLPYNLNSLSQLIAINVIKNKPIIRSYIKTIIDERQKMFKELGKINGAQPFPSDANFILFRCYNADEVFKNLLDKGVLVKNMQSVIKHTLRITIGSPEENKIFIKTLKNSYL